jgi:hypothetical protein
VQRRKPGQANARATLADSHDLALEKPTMSYTRLAAMASAFALATLLGACGDTRSPTLIPPSGGTTPPPATIQGITMPSNIAIVTATNVPE